ncbi:YadA-like family protein [Moraxella catarrhalis]|uniref:YadA-like family protein n=1 Tax=Moraxella catarrhalis TaxID=480 RepID=UPI00128D3506|nr:YadA-like family protein [Moraxella catarrhalis]MPX68553.1 cell surface protein [Moraxella catarrhalis]MPX84432.1 cell surface protein [Moraxella catarrhalis]
MNKIYKVKKNAAGHLVACSEFAKGHTKKAVLGSLLIVGILGMATTASAQVTSSKGTGAHIGVNNNNEAPGNYSFIGGGRYNKAKSTYSTIGGGLFNEATNEYSTIVGGGYNKAKGTYSTIGGGYNNEAKGEKSTIGGGDDNIATGDYSTIGGGDENEAKGKYSTIGGGYQNQAEGEKSTIAGGYKNEAKGIGSFAAGIENKANADNAVALGKENNIEGKNSVAIGSNNTIDSGKQDVFILGSNTDTADAQSGSVLLGNETAGKQATTVENAEVGGLSLTGFAGASKANNGTVSVGKQGKERQIVHVGAGNISADSTDAVNGSQLHALATVVDDNQYDIVNNRADILNNQDDIKDLQKEVKGLDNEVGELSRDINSLHDDVADNQADIKDLDNEVGVLSRDINSLHDDVADNQADIKDLDNEVGVLSRDIGSLHDDVATNQADIAKNQADIKTLENNVEEELLNLSGRLLDQKADIDNNINNIYELAQQQDQHSSDIKTLKNNVEEGLLDLSGRLIDQKADITKNQADIAQNQTDIQDLAAYNELQDAYAKQQTEAIDALNKASSANTDRIATAELGIAENKKDAQIAKAQANENKDGIAKNQADIQLHDKKITNLGILHSMVARAVGNNTQGVATNKADIAKNQADIANNIKNIYELAQQQDQHSSDIKTLAKVSAANTDRIAKNKAEADASFETLTKNQNTLIEQGEALVEQNKAINQELEGFAAHADVQDKQILQNQADIITNKTAIEQNINRTVANGFEIEKNKAGIATNKQELILQNDRLNRINETNNRQDQKIDQLGYALKEQGQHFNNRISAVERQTAGGIANAIAIATLPSPSRAGEHHVLFGSGYHNGQAAVSLGAAGLSDTGKSTYKIGLSWSDAGGLSGGVGGSYRWK